MIQYDWMGFKGSRPLFSDIYHGFHQQLLGGTQHPAEESKGLVGGPCWMDGHLYFKNTNPGHTNQNKQVSKPQTKSHIQIMNRGWVHQWSEYIIIINHECWHTQKKIVVETWNHNILKLWFPPSFPTFSPWFSKMFPSTAPRHIPGAAAIEQLQGWQGWVHLDCCCVQKWGQKWLSLIGKINWWNWWININHCWSIWINH